MVQLVINIPDSDYKWAHDYGMPQFIMVGENSVNPEALARIIRNGKVLPDKHGRLIDVDDVKRQIDVDRPGRSYEDAWALTILDNAPTVLEATGGD